MVQTTIRLDRKVHKIVSENARKKHCSINKIISDLIVEKQKKDAIKDIEKRLENIEDVLKIIMLAENKSRKSLKLLLFSIPKTFRFLLRIHFTLNKLIERIYLDAPADYIKEINNFSIKNASKYDKTIMKRMNESFKMLDEEILESNKDFWKPF